MERVLTHFLLFLFGTKNQKPKNVFPKMCLIERERVKPCFLCLIERERVKSWFFVSYRERGWSPLFFVSYRERGWSPVFLCLIEREGEVLFFVSYRERGWSPVFLCLIEREGKVLFFCDFKIIISRIFPENVSEVPQVVLKIWRFSPSILTTLTNFNDSLIFLCYKETNEFSI